MKQVIKGFTIDRTLYDAVAGTINDSPGVNRKTIAVAIDVSEPQLCNYATDYNDRRSHLPAHRIIPLVKITNNTRIIDYFIREIVEVYVANEIPSIMSLLADRFGLILVKAPRGSSKLKRQGIEQFHETISAFSGALERHFRDDTDPRIWKELRASGNDQMGQIAGFLRDISTRQEAFDFESEADHAA